MCLFLDYLAYTSCQSAYYASQFPLREKNVTEAPEISPKTVHQHQVVQVQLASTAADTNSLAF